MAGYESCGCFRTLKVSPWFTFALDLFILAILAWSLSAMRATAARSLIYRPNKLRPLAAMGSYVLCGMPLFVYMADVGPVVLSHRADGLGEAGELVVLEPETWIGKSFLLGSHISPQVDFAQGRWTVLMYHHDCPKCQEALPQYVRMAEELQRQSSDHRVLLLEIPPYGDEMARGYGAAHHARLSKARDWFVQTPLALQLDDGRVTEVRSGEGLTNQLQSLVKEWRNTHPH